MQKRIWRLLKIHWKRLLLLRGDRRTIARGIALGVSANFIPTIGLGPPLVYWCAGLINGHRAAAIISTIGVKATIPLLYFMNYVVGELLLGRRFTSGLGLTWDWGLFLNLGFSFFLGMVTNFIAAFSVIYYASIYWIERKQGSSCEQTKE